MATNTDDSKDVSTDGRETADLSVPRHEWVDQRFLDEGRFNY